MTATSWRPRTIARHGISFDLVAGVEAAEGDGGDQQFVIQRNDGVVAAVRVGADITLAWWRSNFGERRLAFSAESTVRVCGRAGVRQEVSVPAETATGIVPTPTGGIGHIEQRTAAHIHVVVSSTTTAGMPFVMTWVVPADRRDALRTDEDHFFGSVRCD